MDLQNSKTVARCQCPSSSSLYLPFHSLPFHISLFAFPFSLCPCLFNDLDFHCLPRCSSHIVKLPFHCFTVPFPALPLLVVIETTGAEDTRWFSADNACINTFCFSFLILILQIHCTTTLCTMYNNNDVRSLANHDLSEKSRFFLNIVRKLRLSPYCLQKLPKIYR